MGKLFFSIVTLFVLSTNTINAQATVVTVTLQGNNCDNIELTKDKPHTVTSTGGLDYTDDLDKANQPKESKDKNTVASTGGLDYTDDLDKANQPKESKDKNTVTSTGGLDYTDDLDKANQPKESKDKNAVTSTGGLDYTDDLDLSNNTNEITDKSLNNCDFQLLGLFNTENQNYTDEWDITIIDINGNKIPYSNLAFSNNSFQFDINNNHLNQQGGTYFLIITNKKTGQSTSVKFKF